MHGEAPRLRQRGRSARVAAFGAPEAGDRRTQRCERDLVWLDDRPPIPPADTSRDVLHGACTSVGEGTPRAPLGDVMVSLCAAVLNWAGTPTGVGGLPGPPPWWWRSVAATGLAGCRGAFRGLPSGGASGAMAGPSPLGVRRRLAGERAPDRVALAEGGHGGSRLLGQSPSPRILRTAKPLSRGRQPYSGACRFEDVSDAALPDRGSGLHGAGSLAAHIDAIAAGWPTTGSVTHRRQGLKCGLPDVLVALRSPGHCPPVVSQLSAAPRQFNNSTSRGNMATAFILSSRLVQQNSYFAWRRDGLKPRKGVEVVMLMRLGQTQFLRVYHVMLRALAHGWRTPPTDQIFAAGRLCRRSLCSSMPLVAGVTGALSVDHPRPSLTPCHAQHALPDPARAPARGVEPRQPRIQAATLPARLQSRLQTSAASARSSASAFSTAAQQLSQQHLRDSPGSRVSSEDGVHNSDDFLSRSATFESLGLDPEVIAALQNSGLQRPSQVQSLGSTGQISSYILTCSPHTCYHVCDSRDALSHCRLACRPCKAAAGVRIDHLTCTPCTPWAIACLCAQAHAGSFCTLRLQTYTHVSCSGFDARPWQAPCCSAGLRRRDKPGSA